MTFLDYLMWVGFFASIVIMRHLLEYIQHNNALIAIQREKELEEARRK